jgi:hypothetical protein
MKEHPILFSAPMILAILEGQKTMTRRVIKNNCPFVTGAYFDEETERWYWTTGAEKDRTPADLCLGKCPFGQTGDKLWVRETWQHNPYGGIVYRAGSGIVDCDGRGWKSPIFMPRWASRITLEITAVRVERVQDITETDAWAEGIRTPNPVAGFMLRWEDLNLKRGYGWSANPWVWTITFGRLLP